MFGVSTTAAPTTDHAEEDPSPGTLSRLEIDWAPTTPFPVALARLCKWQTWLEVGGELVLHLNDAWIIDRLRRTLVGIGFRVERCTSSLSDATHQTTLCAVQVSRPQDPARTLRAMLAETYQGSCLDAAVDDAERELAHGVRNNSGFMATRVVADQQPTASIIVLTFNALSDTKLCLASIEAHTHTPHELIVVDNASSDDTVAFLREWAATRPHVRLILNDENTGFAAGNNLGMAAARGAYFVLLNSDTIVTAGWLERMIAVCERHPDVALVGPRSNRVSGAQLVTHAPYQTIEQLHAFAERWSSAHASEDERAVRLVGFCLLVRRELIDAIGGLDERFGRGNFEDDDFCLRAAARGFGARIARDVFIHHSGSKSFKAANIDYENALETNWRIFKAKWGLPVERKLDEGYPATLSPPEQAMQFINLPDINVTHQADANQQLFQSVAREAAPAEETSKAQIARLFDEAEAAAQRGEWELAAKLFENMVQRAPTFGPGYVALASAAFATGQVQAGVLALEHACEIYPTNAELRTQLGVALAHSGQLQRAQEVFLQVLDIDVENIDAIVSLAHLCRASRHYVEACDLLAHAGGIAPESPVVLAAIAATALELGDRAGAEVTLGRLREVAPDHPETVTLAATLATPA